MGIHASSQKIQPPATTAQIDGSDDGLCHAVTTVQQLATGDYCEEAYEWLAKALGAI